MQKDGKDVNALTVDDLALIDEFHTRGREATASLIELLGGGDKLKLHIYIQHINSSFPNFNIMMPCVVIDGIYLPSDWFYY